MAVRKFETAIFFWDFFEKKRYFKGFEILRLPSFWPIQNFLKSSGTTKFYNCCLAQDPLNPTDRTTG